MNFIDKAKISKFFKSRKFYESVFLVVALIIIYIALYFLAQSAEPNAYDLMIKVYTQVTAKNKSKADSRIVMVVIDDKSIEKVGRWPWPRSKYIEMFDYLKNHGKARVIAFDSVINGEDKWNPEDDRYFFEQLKNYPNVRTGFQLIENPQLSYFETGSTVFERFALKKVDDQRQDKENLGVYNSTNTPPKQLIKNVAGMGSVLTAPDNDKVIRTLAYMYYYKGDFYPSLSLSTILAYYDKDNPDITVEDNKITVELLDKNLEIPIEYFPKSYKKPILKKENWLRSVTNTILSPFYSQSNFKQYSKTWIKWYSPLPFKTYSHKSVSSYEVMQALEDIKAGKKPAFNPDIFNDKIVVVGMTATGITTSGIEDIKSTPLFPYHPGVDIQACTIDNLLNADFMTRMDRTTNLYILIGLTLFVILLIFISQDVYLTVLTVLCLAMGYFFVAIFYFFPNNIAVDIVTPELCLIVTPMAIYTYRFFIEKRKRGELSSVLGKVVSSEVMLELLKDPDTAELEGKRAEITILFSDIRGFTTLSEKLAPDEVSKRLNQYFNKMEPIIHKHRGTLDKFMGDGIMAIFGAPVQHEDHALLAVKAALDMQEKLVELNKEWEKEDRPTFSMGIGINTGFCFVGNLGSKKRIQYTAIGDAVNIASRLEQMNKPFNTKIIISQFTYEKVRNFVEVRALKKESIRGRTEAVMIYELKGIRDPKDFMINQQTNIK